MHKVKYIPSDWVNYYQSYLTIGTGLELRFAFSNTRRKPSNIECPLSNRSSLTDVMMLPVLLDKKVVNKRLPGQRQLDK